MKIRSYLASDRDAVIAVWEKCGLVVPWNDPQKDIKRKLTVQPDLFLVGLYQDNIIATAMVGFDGHRGWVYYLAVKPEFQKMSIGKKMMDEAEHRLVKLGCPKIDIIVRKTNLEVINFYERIGYEIDGVTTMSKRLIIDQ